MLEGAGSEDEPLHPAVHAALAHASALMSKYQAYTSDSDIYHICMSESHSAACVDLSDGSYRPPPALQVVAPPAWLDPAHD